MNDLEFSCPWCDQHLESPPDMAGNVIACPSCQKEIRVPARSKPSQPSTQRMQKRDAAPRFPIIIRSSTRALYATYVWRAIGWTFGLILVIAATWSLNNLGEQGVGNFIAWVWVIFAVLLSFSLVRLWFAYRRIKHTEYRIYANKIETTSYLFRFMGAYNNVANLAQLRQIQASVNSLFDLWFFKCGKVSITVSGDLVDFELENIYMPGLVKKQIEEIVFGKENVEYGNTVEPETEHGH